MLFNSFDFLIFLVFVLFIYYILATKPQNILLLVASYVFYGLWDWRFLCLLFGTSAVDYFISHWMHKTADPAKKKQILLISLAANLGSLGFFKYYNFFTESFVSLAASFGFEVEPMLLNIILPVGISFYTFQSLSYTIDVYRKEIVPCSSLLDFLLYVSFFPQLVAGPIERASHLIPQLQRSRVVTYDAIREGCFLILFGFFQKLVIADNLAIIANQCFDNPARYSSWNLLVGVYAFAFQIYCDFSGYSLIAVGTAGLLGIHLMVNFKVPYFSVNAAEFWRRWHISLSSWLRDYLYIPLGGNRTGNTYANLMITMLIGGLWHGAKWTMLIWGGIQGLYLSVHRKLTGLPSREHVVVSENFKFALRPIIGVFVTFHLICLAWVFFRATSLSNAVDYLANLRSNVGNSGISSLSAVGLVLIATMCLLDVFHYKRGEAFFCREWNVVSRSLVYVALFLSIVFLGARRVEPFIYFQF